MGRQGGIPRAAPSILFLRLGKLGDMMVSAWLLQAARRAHPRARLGLVTLPRSLAFSRALPFLDEVQAWSPLGLPALALRLRGRWDWMVDLNELPSRRSKLALGLFKPAHLAAFRATGLPADILIDAPSKEDSHVMERMAAAAKALGFKAAKAGLKPVVPLPAASLSAARARAGKGRVVALNLSAGHASRYWPPRNWERLAQGLLAWDPGLSLQILCDPKDEALAAQLKAALPAARLRPGPSRGLWDFLASIAACSLLISPDTSAVHAASAFGVPVVGLYPEPAWNLASWGPWGKGHQALRSSKDGSLDIHPETVHAAALRALKTRRPLP